MSKDENNDFLEPDIGNKEINYIARKHLTIKEKLILLDVKSRYPQISLEFMENLFCIKKYLIKNFFDQEFLIVESKLNKLNNFNIDGKKERRKRTK